VERGSANEKGLAVLPSQVGSIGGYAIVAYLITPAASLKIPESTSLVGSGSVAALTKVSVVAFPLKLKFKQAPAHAINCSCVVILEGIFERSKSIAMSLRKNACLDIVP